MATVTGIITYSIIDANNMQSSYSQYFQAVDTLTLAQVQTYLAEMGPLLNAVIEGQIVKGELRVITENVGTVRGAPETGSRVEDTGLFTFGITSSPYTQAIDIPTFARAKVVKGIIDLTDADVVAWEGEVLTPTTAFVGKSKKGETLTGINSGRETFRKHRKALKTAASRAG